MRGPIRASVAGGEPYKVARTIDPTSAAARLEDGGRGRATLVEVEADGTERRTRLLLGPAAADPADGSILREVVVDGWRCEVRVEPERRAVLRDRARRAAGAAGHGGPVEVRAIIPGRVVTVAVAEGDAIEAGDTLLVVEAMKMQNELRAPVAGTVRTMAVGPGSTVELGDLLAVIA